MINLTRKNQKLFAGNAANNGQFGSLQTGAKVLSTDPDVLQSLAAYENGWNDAVISGEQLPSLEEFQALNYLNTYQTGYLLQKGFPEYNTDTTYYIGDLTREIGGTKIYRSITNSNQGNVLTDITNWALLGSFYIMLKQITISNDAGDTDHDIAFSAGNFEFNDGSGQANFSAQTGSIDALFGTGTGMLDIGTVGDAPYDLYPVYNPTTGLSKPLATISGGSPTMTLPNADGYTILGKKIAALHTDGSFNIRNGEWVFANGLYKFTYDSRILDISTATPSTTRVAVPISAPANSEVRLRGSLVDDDVSDVGIVFTEEGQVDLVPDESNGDLIADNAYRSVSEFTRQTNSSSEIYYRSSDASVTEFNVYNLGWKEYL